MKGLNMYDIKKDEHRLYMRDTYRNESIPYLFGRDIIEYDMERAGLSLIKEFDLLPQSDIDYLSKIEKHMSDITIGKLQLKDKDFKKRFQEAFPVARQLFFTRNRLDSSNVLSIKKDAIFTIARCNEQRVGKYINFREKNRYTSYFTIPKVKGSRLPTLEVYRRGDTIDIKGMGKDFDILDKHANGIIKLFVIFTRYMEMSSIENTLDYMRGFIARYKALELPIDYYRQFNRDSQYVLQDHIDGSEYGYDEYDTVEDLDITFNYKYIILPLLKMVL